MTEEQITNGNWDACKMYVLRELQRMNDMHEKMDGKMDGLKDQLTAMKIQVAAIGGVSGLVVTIVTMLIAGAIK
jgi:hypothetical protein